jgi:hypothetical protein
MALTWNASPGELWTATAGPYLLEARPKGDGRWNWQVTLEGARAAEATGVARSLGSARTVAEQYVMRTGRA